MQSLTRLAASDRAVPVITVPEPPVTLTISPGLSTSGLPIWHRATGLFTSRTGPASPCPFLCVDWQCQRRPVQVARKSVLGLL